MKIRIGPKAFSNGIIPTLSRVLLELNVLLYKSVRGCDYVVHYVSVWFNRRYRSRYISGNTFSP
jgi:hypothetical protein